LSYSQGAEGVLVNCQKGCPIEDVLRALDMPLSDLFDTPREKGSDDDGMWTPAGRATTRYPYTDADGTVLFFIFRTADKKFLPGCPDATEKSGYVWNLRAVPRPLPLFRLQKVIAAVAAGETIYLCEGEKDVHTVEALGLTATTKPDGAGGGGRWNKVDVSPLHGARVVVLPDRDPDGTKYVIGFREVIGDKADVRVIHLPDLPDKGDVTDWVAAGGTREQLEAMTVAPEPGVRENVQSTPGLIVESVGEVLAGVDAAPKPKYLMRRVWPFDAYGILGAAMKAGKTWLVIDFVIAVLTGGAWLGRFECDTSGPVLMFLGEGGPRKMSRRLRAVAAFYAVPDLASLPLRLCFRAPHLTKPEHLQIIAAELEEHHPVLVVLDPLYLSARGANASQLVEMGEVLETIQNLCQSVGAALMVTHHHNRSEGRGMSRLSGAGPAEWGRVIVSAQVKTKHTDADTLESSVTLEIDVEGDEVAETTLRIRRKVSAIDPDDLSSPLIYSVELLADAAEPDQQDDGLTPSARRVLAILNKSSDWHDVKALGDGLARDSSGFPLKARTIQTACKGLVEAGLIEAVGMRGSNAFRWRAVFPANHPADDGRNGV
jgi:hypothetical protein